MNNAVWASGMRRVEDEKTVFRTNRFACLRITTPAFAHAVAKAAQGLPDGAVVLVIYLACIATPPTGENRTIALDNPGQGAVETAKCILSRSGGDLLREEFMLLHLLEDVLGDS